MLTQAVRTRLVQLPLWSAAALTHIAVRLASLPAFVILSLMDPRKSFLSWFSAVDGIWYRQIAAQGYSHELVLNATTGGLAKPSPIAFYPVFPFSVRAVMTLARLPFSVAGPLTGFVFGLAGSIAVAYLLRTVAPALVERRPEVPVLAVAAVNAFPTGAVLSFAYSEGLALLLVACALLLINRRYYVWAAIPVVILGFTRAVALPIVAVLVWQTIVRWRSGDTPSRLQWVKLTGLTVVGLLSAFAWPTVAGWITGNSSAFFMAQSYYRHGGDATALFRGFSDRLSAHLPGPVAAVVIVALIGIIAFASLNRRVRELGPELQAWGGSYLIYLIAVSDLDASGLRFLLLSITVPVLLVICWQRRMETAGALVLLMIGQYAWIIGIWGHHFPGHLGP